jgi:uncharacterized membrane protein YhaH (DUF805 family)
MNMREVIEFNFKNVGVLKGRTNRSDYWKWILFAYGPIFAVSILLIVLSPNFFPVIRNIIIIACIVQILIVMVASFSATVRRLHDLNANGWILLTCFIPLGLFFMIYALAQKGNPKKNRFGNP